MWKLGFAVCAIGAVALASEFTFTIGSPVASQDFQMKSAAFVFRTEGCAEPSKAQVGGSAEGMVKGARKSVALKIAAASKPGVYAVYQTWPTEGEWVVNLKGSCAGASAGAVIPMGPKGFIRESAKFFPRPANDAEIDASLKGGKK